ncbi:TIGR02391 family protein [Pseudonocardia nigra]|uniref:TIGR02391 family protein n=1 Tax=Pseudonocardia nigra TaxID=1921578 RepID=UPI001C5D2C19|nr:TIGR02391 family protein [Pseudonocardia nigra]
MSSHSDGQDRFYRRYGGAIVAAVVIGLISGLAIFASPQYGDSIGLRVANGIGAGLFFGGAAFVIGYAITKLVSRRRGSDPAGTRSSEQPDFGSRSGERAAAPTSAFGDRAFLLHLDQLDRLVRDAANSHWPHGNYVAAVESAARAVNAALQTRTGLHRLSESDLVNHAFSEKAPQSGDARLRFPGDRNSRTWMSRTTGAKALGVACFSGVRNIAAHQYRPEWSREDSFEYLVMFSVFMRWVRECEVER